jgi:D-glycero-alpha-D-manno-heptose-7-phosphate kinase
VIITQTPYRVSFVGGGTDLPAFYEQEYGAVVSVAIQRHLYVTVHGRFERNIRVAYSRTETAARVDDLRHGLVREALKLTGVVDPIEVTTIGDVPAGAGMGSSSSLTVGVLHALHARQGRYVDRERLASEACRIEIDILGHPIGKQDQYAAAFGGMNYIRFNPDGTVDVEPMSPCPAFFAGLERRALLFYTGHQRDANTILRRLSVMTPERRSILRELRDLADELRTTVLGSGDVDRVAGILHQGWQLKRSQDTGISGSGVDEWYCAARRAGAQGGKLLGAGGGGFLLVLAPPDRHEAIRAALNHPQELPFAIDRSGSRVVFVSERQ